MENEEEVCSRKGFYKFYNSTNFNKSNNFKKSNNSNK